MTTITKERLLTIKQWRETYGPGSNVVLPAEEAEELARIALASLEAEPVVYMWDSERKDIDAPGYYRTEHLVFAESSVKQWGGRVVPLYTAPPAPVVPEGLVKAVRFYEQVKCENPPAETGAWKDAVDWVLKEACQAVNIGNKGE
ncbi:hypothetical protein KUS98_003200 [Escherichia coli]|nr:hypothetical protein [Escherichia coli]